MSLTMELRKSKRTGLLPAFIGGGILAAAVPIVNMKFRSKLYLGLDASPVQVLLDANWQMMSMLNILLAVAGACLMYHTEYADNAIQKMNTLPLRESKLFFGKLALMAVLCITVLIIEFSSIAFCSVYWFPSHTDMWVELMESFDYAFILMLPVMLSSLFIASACKNMWISLGIGVICVFTATMLPASNFVLSLFPFALPFHIFMGAEASIIHSFSAAGAIESVVIAVAEVIFLKVRRSFK